MLNRFKRTYKTKDHMNMTANSEEWTEEKMNTYRLYPQTRPQAPYPQEGLFSGTLLKSVGTWYENGRWHYGIHPMVMAGTMRPTMGRFGPALLSYYAKKVETECALQPKFTFTDGQQVDVGALVTFEGFHAASRYIDQLKYQFPKVVIKVG